MEEHVISKVLVTGATGLLGGHVVRALLAQERKVVALARDRAKAETMLGDAPVRLLVADIRDADELAPALEECDAVVHTAAYFREYYQPGSHAAALREINVDAALGLMRSAAARGIRRFVHIGSAGTIGRKSDGSPGDEQTPPAPIGRRNRYFRSKAEAYEAIRLLQPSSAMDVIEILPAWMWGPGDAGPTGSGQFVLDFVAGKLPGVLAGGGGVVDARDVASAVVAALTRGRRGQRYIVGGRYLTTDEIAAALAEATGLPAPTRRIPYPAAWLVAALSGLTGHRSPITLQALRTVRAHVSVSSAKAERELGASFRPFEQTARDIVRWYVEHGYMADAPPAFHHVGQARGSLQ